MDISDFKSSRFNIIGLSSQIKGDLHLSGRSSIEGSVVGNIFSDDESIVIIEKNAVITGNVNAFNIEVFGKVIGELNARGTLSIRPGSQVEGTIKSERLVIYPGALVNTKADAG